jgi:hypothetical protein
MITPMMKMKKTKIPNERKLIDQWGSPVLESKMELMGATILKMKLKTKDNRSRMILKGRRMMNP